VFVARSQTGVTPPHDALDVHETHVPVPTLQAGVEPPHWLVLVSEHWPQEPLAWQAGVAPPHSALLAQARHMLVVVSQTGLVPEHWLFDVQPTQTPALALHTGVDPPHLVEFAREHWPQEPLVWHAGVMPPHSLSPLHPRQVWKAGSQMGDAPEQSASAVQPTHVPVVV